MSIPENRNLYEQVKAEADKKYDKPSAYKSGWIVKEYKKRGGTYKGKKDEKKGLTRWYKEEWADIGGKDYPVYRPTKRITKDTPLTASEIDPKQAKKQIKRKQIIKGSKNLPPFQKKIGGYNIMDGMENVDFAAIGAALEQANQAAAQAQQQAPPSPRSVADPRVVGGACGKRECECLTGDGAFFPPKDPDNEYADNRVVISHQAKRQLPFQ